MARCVGTGELFGTGHCSKLTVSMHGVCQPNVSTWCVTILKFIEGGHMV